MTGMKGNSRLGRMVLLPLCLGLAHCSDDDACVNPSCAPPETPPVAISVVDAFPMLDFTLPLFFAHAPGDSQRAFVATQDGLVHVFENRADVAAASVFLDIDDRVTNDGGELGLLGLAFDPDYATNGFFYVNYNPNFANPWRTQISRFEVTVDPDVADPASEVFLLDFEQPFANHNGGWLGFGPDGKLYIGSGDGGSGGDPDNNAQNLNTPLGKILRINTDGSTPPDNPFAGVTGRADIWAFGLRNPYRASFDRGSGELIAGDVGQSQREEIDLIVRGGNYGWRKFEGTLVFNATDPTPPNVIAPIFEYDHSNGRCSIIGGYVYRGTALTGHAGSYFYADFCSGELWELRRNGSAVTNTLVGNVPGNPTSFGEDTAGELYVTSFDGNVYKLVPE